MRHLLASLLALCVGLCTPTARAVIIDDFQINQTLAANIGIQDVNASIIGPGSQILGTERDLRIVKTGGSVSNINIVFGTLQASVGANSFGTVTLQWDGTADATKNTIDSAGLPFVDLTDGGTSDTIGAWIGNGLAPITATVTVWADGGSGTVASTNSLVIPPSYSGEVYFSYEDFSTEVLFSQARAVQLELTIPLGGTIDLKLLQTIDLFPVAVPEPSACVLLLPLLLGVEWRRRRLAFSEKLKQSSEQSAARGVKV